MDESFGLTREELVKEFNRLKQWTVGTGAAVFAVMMLAVWANLPAPLVEQPPQAGPVIIINVPSQISPAAPVAPPPKP
jgi:hypothetical protein